MTDAERACCDSATRLEFVLLLKTYQRLGYFVTSEQVPNAIAEHVASSIGEPYDRENLRQYDVSQARRKNLSEVREFLVVKPFGDDGKTLMRQTFAEAALTKEDVIDIINLSMLDVLSDTMRWLNWGQFFGPLSGHESKLEDEERRQILTTFAYGTGLGPTQVAKNVSGVSDRQIADAGTKGIAG